MRRVVNSGGRRRDRERKARESINEKLERGDERRRREEKIHKEKKEKEQR